MLAKSDQYHPPLPDNLQPNGKQEICSSRQDLIKRLPCLPCTMGRVVSLHLPVVCMSQAISCFPPPSFFCLQCASVPAFVLPKFRPRLHRTFAGFASLVCLTAHHGKMGVWMPSLLSLTLLNLCTCHISPLYHKVSLNFQP